MIFYRNMLRRFRHHVKKLSHHGNDNFEQLKFEDFSDRPNLVFKNFSVPEKFFKTKKNFQKTCGYPGVRTRQMYNTADRW